ncbi:glycosyltransferase family 2 protein [Acetobacteraceae bacterium ESL0709]|nr:glycosyltransferase family 2 protein [Acetobacteraceae bacterium ESL0697]MDF7677458.1 glycosyltransferase family 2 protein [Acetobacteraceae bacterium ESL0709]
MMSKSEPALSETCCEKSPEITFFQIRTWHDAGLAVRLRDGQLNQHQNPAAEGFAPVVAFQISTFPRQLFLTTDRPDKPIIWLHHYGAPRGTVLTVNIKCCGPANSFWSIEDPHTLGKFFTTRPFTDGKDTNHVVGDCHHVMAWEQFSLEPITVSPELHEEANYVAQLFRYDLTTGDIIAFIKNYKGSNIQPLLDAVLPFIRWNELEKLGPLFLEDKNLLKHLQKVTASNKWLERILPDLIDWNNKQSSSRKKPARLPAKLTSSFDDADMAWAGSDRTFAGFFHAATHLARRCVKPKRGTCLLSTQRNEGLYLLEWIAYHQAVGIEHFFIYSNNNEDKSDLLLEELAQKGIITWISNEVDPKTSPQFKAYGHAFNALPDILDFEWCFVLDGDEFITLSPHYPQITDFLNEIERKETDAIAVNWRFIGSALNVNGLADLAIPLTERNTRIVGSGAIGEGWRLVKSACRPQKTLHSRAHHPVWYHSASYSFRLTNGELHEFIQPPPGFQRDPAFADKGCFDELYISHFYFKSMTEWTWKHARNSGADPTKAMDSSRYNNQWANAFGLQLKDQQQTKNEWILQRADATRHALAELRSVPAIRKAETQVRQAVEAFLYALKPRLDEENLSSRITEEWQFILQDLDLEIIGHIPASTETI